MRVCVPVKDAILNPNPNPKPEALDHSVYWYGVESANLLAERNAVYALAGRTCNGKCVSKRAIGSGSFAYLQRPGVYRSGLGELYPLDWNESI